jgi:hypothetical protein
VLLNGWNIEGGRLMPDRRRQFDLRTLLTIRKEREILRRTQLIARRIIRNTERLISDQGERPRRMP